MKLRASMRRLVCVATLVSGGLAATATSSIYAADMSWLQHEGFISMTMVYRTKGTGNNLPTSFGAIPFSNTVAGKLTETRLSAQDTTLGLKADTDWGNDIHVGGLVEGDFLGNDAANAYVDSNSHTFRVRLAYADIHTSQWELLFGQAWSLMTPNREGISADSSKVFRTINIDPSYTPGLAWARQGQVRVVWHPNQNYALGFSIESPDQYTGAGEVTFPSGFNAQLAGQFDAANTTGSPDGIPDMILKGAYDTMFLTNHHLHLEALGYARQFQVKYLSGTTAGFVHEQTWTGGVGVTAIVDVLPQLRAIATGTSGTAAGRYIGGLGPDVVVEPVGTDNSGSGGGTTGDDLRLHGVQASAFVSGFEWDVTPVTTAAGYFGMAHFNHAAYPDITANHTPPPYVGFGGVNSANNNNKDVEEVSADLTHVFLKHEKYGAIKGLMQVSWVRRTAWFVAAGAPEFTNTIMAYASLRWMLP